MSERSVTRTERHCDWCGHVEAHTQHDGAPATWQEVGYSIELKVGWCDGMSSEHPFALAYDLVRHNSASGKNEVSGLQPDRLNQLRLATERDVLLVKLIVGLGQERREWPRPGGWSRLALCRECIAAVATACARAEAERLNARGERTTATGDGVGAAE